MTIHSLFRFALILLMLASQSFAHQKRISLTIDDLPFVGEARNFHLNMIVDTLKEQQVPATGFIIAKEVSDNNWEVLEKFRDAGLGLGNHTYSHANLNRLKTSAYIHEINRADRILQRVLTEPKYFRYPYLAMSSGAKRNEILCYLAKKNYQVAPITVDSKDFVFNQRLLAMPEIERRKYLEELKPFYLDFIWQQTMNAEEHAQYHHNPDQAQILLIHANLINAYVLPDLIKLYKDHGYTFVGLEEALKTLKEPTHCKLAQLNKKPLPKKEAKVSKENENSDDQEDFIEWD